MGVFYVLFTYICLAVLIVFLSAKLSDYIDLLDKKTKISGAFLGGVLLAAVTSLPELFTSISSVVFLNETGLVIGNILGSNLLDILILGVCILMFYKAYSKSGLYTSTHFSVVIGLFCMYACMLITLFLGDKYQLKIGSFNLVFLAIAVIYGITIYKMPKNDEGEEDGVDLEIKGMNLSVKQIVARFIICAVFLVVTSIMITYVTDDLADLFNLTASTAGVLFLAIATSLPEVVSTISLCRKGNFDAGFGNILGSCLFNTFVLFIAELLAFKTSILVPLDFDSIKLVLLNVVSISFITIALYIKKLSKELKNKRLVEYIIAVVVIIMYLLYYVIV